MYTGRFWGCRRTSGTLVVVVCSAPSTGCTHCDFLANWACRIRSAAQRITFDWLFSEGNLSKVIQTLLVSLFEWQTTSTWWHREEFPHMQFCLCQSLRCIQAQLFWLRHKRHEATQQSVFVANSSLISAQCVRSLGYERLETGPAYQHLFVLSVHKSKVFKQLVSSVFVLNWEAMVVACTSATAP